MGGLRRSMKSLRQVKGPLTGESRQGAGQNYSSLFFPGEYQWDVFREKCINSSPDELTVQELVLLTETEVGLIESLEVARNALPFNSTEEVMSSLHHYEHPSRLL